MITDFRPSIRPETASRATMSITSKCSKAGALRLCGVVAIHAALDVLGPIFSKWYPLLLLSLLLLLLLLLLLPTARFAGKGNPP